MKCDICGGQLEMEIGGSKAKCQKCGMVYTINKMKEKYETVDCSTLRVKVLKAKKALFSKTVYVTGLIESGTIRARDILCVEGIGYPSFKVEYAYRNDHSNEVKLHLTNVPKNGLVSGQVLIYSLEVDHYFESIIHEFFRNYELSKDVHITDDGVDVNFLLLKDGQPQLAIILCNSRGYNAKEITNTMDVLTENGIAVQRYFRDFENKREYVRKRMKSVL